MDIQRLRNMPAGADRCRAAHDATEKANRDAARFRDDIGRLAALLVDPARHGQSKASVSRRAGIAVQNLFPAKAVLPSPTGKIAKLSLAEAEQMLTERATAYRAGQDIAKAAREVRREDLAALYQGHIDGRQWDIPDLARETGMSDSLVKADLVAVGVELRPAVGPRTASLEDASATLAEIARMLRVDYKRLKDAVQAHRRGGTLPDGIDAGGEETGEDRRYVPRVVAEWWPTIRSSKRAAYAPQGMKLADLARRYEEPYEKVKTAVRYAEDDGVLPAGVKYDDGTFNEEAWLAWWQSRGVSLADIAAEQGVDYERLRQRVRVYTAKHELPEGVRLGARKWNRDRFMTEVWPHVNG